MQYVSLANGDYNDEHCSLSEVQWELNEGCQKWVLITKFKITGEQLAKIQTIFDENNDVEKEEKKK